MISWLNFLKLLFLNLKNIFYLYWLNNFYYPVLPRYGANGHFIEGDYPDGKILFPLEGPLTNETHKDNSLKISIGSELVESNVFDDNSGNKNYGFIISDYKPKFDRETLKPERTKNISQTRTSKTDGAF